MQIFVRAVEIYSSSFIILVHSFLLHILIPIGVKLLRDSNDIYVSNFLSHTGYRITEGFKLKKVYEHHIKRRPTNIPLILYSADLFTCIIIPFIVLSEVPIPDLWTYLGFSVITLVISFILWLRELKHHMLVFKSETWLLLCEMCYMPLSPADTTLLFRDRDYNTYTWVTRNLDGFEIGQCYQAQCFGTYVEFLSNVSRDPKTVRYVPVRTLRSRTFRCGIIPALLLFILSIVLIWRALTYNDNLILTLGLSVLGNTLLLVPYPCQRKLTTVALRHSCMYKDLPGNYTYTFVLADRFGNTFYYQTDDYKALEEDVTYKCMCIGRRVKAVNTENNVYIEQRYKPRVTQPTLPVHWVSVIILPSILICELMGQHLIEYILLVVFITLYMRLYRYLSQGEF